MAVPTLYTFDDVLIRPGKSNIEPQEAQLATKLGKHIALKIPILSAAMDRVTGVAMATELAKIGGLGVLHRNCSSSEQADMVRAVRTHTDTVAAACGPFDTERAEALTKAGASVLVIDCAHGHNQKVIAAAKEIKRKTRAYIVVGNVATKEAARDLAPIADAIKVGVGPGSICTTRTVSGVGVPQLSAIMEVAAAVRDTRIPVIADGGIRTSGDIAKALAAGAHAVMLGSMLAGADVAPGKKVKHNGVWHKEYRGMGSRAVLTAGAAADRYLTKGRALVPEGVEALVPCTGPIRDTVGELAGGVQVAMGYVGARTLAEFRRKSRFIQVTHATVVESNPHDVAVQR